MTPQLAKSLSLQIASDGTILSMRDLRHNHPLDDQPLPSSPSPSLARDTETLLQESHTMRRRTNAGRDGLMQSRHYQTNTTAASSSSPAPSHEIYLTPRRQKTICERLFDYFWSY